LPAAVSRSTTVSMSFSKNGSRLEQQRAERQLAIVGIGHRQPFL
jgi:hypothetical protein